MFNTNYSYLVFVAKGLRGLKLLYNGLHKSKVLYKDFTQNQRLLVRHKIKQIRTVIPTWDYTKRDLGTEASVHHKKTKTEEPLLNEEPYYWLHCWLNNYKRAAPLHYSARVCQGISFPFVRARFLQNNQLTCPGTVLERILKGSFRTHSESFYQLHLTIF